MGRIFHHFLSKFCLQFCPSFEPRIAGGQAQAWWMACNVDNCWSAQDRKIAPSGNVNWSLLNMLAKYFALIRNYVLSVSNFRKESMLFTTKGRFWNQFLQHYWQASFNGDSFNSQSRFDAYVIGKHPSMVIPLIANQGLTPLLLVPWSLLGLFMHRVFIVLAFNRKTGRSLCLLQRPFVVHSNRKFLL